MDKTGTFYTSFTLLSGQVSRPRKITNGIHVNAPECHENLNLENREGKTHLPKRAFQRCKKTLDVNSVPSVSLCVPWIYSVFWMFQNELPEEKKPRNTQTSS